MATDINRTTTITLPGEVSSEILQKTQESSAVMALARSIKLPGLGVTIPVITGDPEAAWVGETDKKPVKRGTLATKVMQPYTLAVIVTLEHGQITGIEPTCDSPENELYVRNAAEVVVPADFIF